MENASMRPSSLLLEMLLFFCAFFLPGYLTQGASISGGPVSTLAMLQVIVAGVPQLLLMVFVVCVSRGESPESFGLRGLGGKDCLWIAALLILAFAIAAPLVGLASLLPPGWSRAFPLGDRWGLRDASQIPAALLFGLTAGYREEFFFRAYALKRLGQIGIPLPAAVAASTALFSAGHIYEGPAGFATAVVMGALFAVAYLRIRNLHVVAVAHGLYNAAALALSLVAARLPI